MTPTCPMCGNYLYWEETKRITICARCTPPKPGESIIALRMLKKGDDGDHRPYAW
jgi:hypothetical protein